jgi:hypothetical protein
MVDEPVTGVTDAAECIEYGNSGEQSSVEVHIALGLGRLLNPVAAGRALSGQRARAENNGVA